MLFYGLWCNEKMEIIFIFCVLSLIFFYSECTSTDSLADAKNCSIPGQSLSRWFQLSIFGLLPNTAHPRRGDIPA